MKKYLIYWEDEGNVNRGNMIIEIEGELDLLELQDKISRINGVEYPIIKFMVRL